MGREQVDRLPTEAIDALLLVGLNILGLKDIALAIDRPNPPDAKQIERRTASRQCIGRAALQAEHPLVDIDREERPIVLPLKRIKRLVVLVVAAHKDKRAGRGAQRRGGALVIACEII